MLTFSLLLKHYDAIIKQLTYTDNGSKF